MATLLLSCVLILISSLGLLPVQSLWPLGLVLIGGVVLIMCFLWLRWQLRS